MDFHVFVFWNNGMYASRYNKIVIIQYNIEKSNVICI